MDVWYGGGCTAGAMVCGTGIVRSTESRLIIHHGPRNENAENGAVAAVPPASCKTSTFQSLLAAASHACTRRSGTG